MLFLMRGRRLGTNIRTTRIQLSASSLALTANFGDTVGVNSDEITATGVPNALTNVAVVASEAWVTPSHVAGVISAVCEPDGLSVGVHTFTITVTADNADSKIIQGIFEILAIAVPILKVDPLTWVYDTVEGGGNPANKSSNITNDGAGTLTGVSAVEVVDRSWLTLSLTGTGNSQNVAGAVNNTGLLNSASPYTATVRVDATNSDLLNGPIDIAVTVNVAPPIVPGDWPSPPSWYQPPTGLTFNSATGRFEGTNITTPFVQPSLSESFTDTGSPVTNMANLQSTLDGWAASAVRKMLIIPAGTVFRGNLITPANSAAGWVDLRVENYTLPSVAPSSSTGLFIIESPNTSPAVQSTAAGGITTTHGRYAFHGAEFRPISTLATTTSTNVVVVRLGNTSNQTTLTRVPDGFYFEGCWVHGWSNKNVLRGVEWHCSNLHMYRTRVSEIHNKPVGGSGGDSQCVWGWNGPGPIFLDECVLSGADECFGTGGAVPLISTNIASDQWLRRCRTDKPASMLTDGWACKNHMEWKFAKRVLVEECYHTGLPTWYDAGQQTVYGLKVQLNGAFPAADFDHFLSYNCACDRVPQMAYFVVDPTFTLKHMAIVNFAGTNMNEVGDWAGGAQRVGNALGLAWNMGTVADAYFDHITLVTDTGEMPDGCWRLVGGTMTNLTMTNILADCNTTAPTGWGGIANSSGQGSAALAAKVTGYSIDAVHFIGTGSVPSEPTQLSGYPTGCKGYSSKTAVGFTNVATHDYSLTAGSAANGTGSDGFDIGIHDWASHRARINTVPS